jgi:MIR domain
MNLDIKIENYATSSGLWIIENENQFLGGFITYESKIRFKHIITGLYLSAQI